MEPNHFLTRLTAASAVADKIDGGPVQSGPPRTVGAASASAARVRLISRKAMISDMAAGCGGATRGRGRDWEGVGERRWITSASRDARYAQGAGVAMAKSRLDFDFAPGPMGALGPLDAPEAWREVVVAWWGAGVPIRPPLASRGGKCL